MFNLTVQISERYFESKAVSPHLGRSLIVDILKDYSQLRALHFLIQMMEKNAALIHRSFDDFQLAVVSLAPCILGQAFGKNVLGSLLLHRRYSTTPPTSRVRFVNHRRTAPRRVRTTSCRRERFAFTRAIRDLGLFETKTNFSV